MILDTLLNVASGGITGLVGALFTKGLDIWQEGKKQDFQLKLLDAQTKASIAEKEAGIRVAQAEAEGKLAVEDSKAFKASFDLEPKRFATGEAPKNWVGTFGWLLLTLLDFIRGSVRPGLTGYLCYIATMLYWHSQEMVKVHDLAMYNDVLAQVYKSIVDTLLYMFTVCGTWWFGTRANNGKK